MIKYVAHKIANSTLHSDPWDHLIIDDFLPQNKYLELVDIVKTTNSGAKPPGASVENQIIIDTDHTTDNRKFWDKWHNIFSDDRITQALKTKFKFNKDFHVLRCDIHKCHEGFSLGRHNDIKKGIVSILSLQLYLPLDNLAAQDGVVLHGEQDKRIDYVPNRAWAFICGENTFHSVPQCNRTRHSVLMKNVVMQ